MTRRALLWLIPLALLIAATGVAIFFTATESGLRLLWPRLARMLPGELSVESMEGRLTGPIELHGLRYRQDGMSLAIERVSANWQPGALLFGKLRITQLHAEGVALTLPPAADEPVSAPLTMPALPLPLSVADARLGRISVARGGDAPVFVEVTEFDFQIDRRALEIRSLKTHAETLRLDARGRITLAGEITADLRTDWSVTLPGNTKVRGGGTITGNLAELHLDQRIEAPASARLQAVLHDWPAQPHWEARLDIEETDARQLNASWPELALRTAAEGKGDFQNWSVAGNFHLRQEQYGKLDGAFTLRHTPEFWTLERLEIRMPDGAARLNAKAQYPTHGATRALKLDAEWRALAWPLAGEATFTSQRGNLRLAGMPENYTLRLEAAVAGRHVPLTNWTIRGRGDVTHLDLDHIEARLLDGRLAGSGRLFWHPDLAWQLTLAGDALDPGRHWRDWPGRLAIKTDTRGSLRQDRLRADFTISDARGELRGQKFSAGGALLIDGERYRLSDLAVDMGEARLRAAGTLDDRWELSWEARIDNLAALLPARGALATEGRVTGSRATPRMVVTARARDIVLEPHRLTPLDADIHLDLQAHARGLEGQLTLTLDNGGHIEGRVRLPGLVARAGVTKSQPIEGELSARMSRLELLTAFFPDVEDTRGELRASLTLDGTLGDPRLTGRVTLANGTAQVPRLGLTLKAIELNAESDGQNRIRFEGRLRSGGELRFNGRMQWPTDNARDWSAELALKGERVEAVKIPEAWVLVSPDLRLRARPRRVDVEGELVVPEARIEPLQTSSAVPVSRDVILVNAPDDLATGRTPWDLHSQVRVTLGDKVRFKGFGLTGNITGSVTATDEPEKITTARGELNVNAGKYQAYGRDLDVERGRLIFAGGPIDNPGIDARAVRRVGEVLAGISVRGTLKLPVLTLFSDPPMPQTDILSYLILGQPLQQASTAEGRTLLGAASALTLTGGDRLARDIGARFGFEEVAIQTSGTPGEASLVVGRYLSPKLFIAYSVGLFEQINLLRLRYQLNSRWTVQTETGTHSGADLLFTIER